MLMSSVFDAVVTIPLWKSGVVKPERKAILFSDVVYCRLYLLDSCNDLWVTSFLSHFAARCYASAVVWPRDLWQWGCGGIFKPEVVSWNGYLGMDPGGYPVPKVPESPSTSQGNVVEKISSGKSGLKLFIVSCMFVFIFDFAELLQFPCLESDHPAQKCVTYFIVHLLHGMQ